MTSVLRSAFRVYLFRLPRESLTLPPQIGDPMPGTVTGRYASASLVISARGVASTKLHPRSDCVILSERGTCSLGRFLPSDVLKGVLLGVFYGIVFSNK